MTAAAALAGCDVFIAPAEPGVGADEARPGTAAFAHSQTEDLSGSYPVGEAQVGTADLRLRSLFIGQTPDFRAWEAGRRTAGYAPVMLEFSTTGGGSERVAADSYSVSDDRVRMTGRSAGGERITFDGRMDVGALATARRNLGGGEAAAVTATVRIGDRTVSGVRLYWNGGD
jgi:hypothetical protein